MDCFVMVQEFEIQLPEAKNESQNQDYEKNTFKGKKLSESLRKESGLLHAAPSTLENNLNADILWHLNTHQLAKGSFVEVGQ